MVKAAGKSRNVVSNQDRAELARLRLENQQLRQKVEQSEAVQEILGKAFELLDGITKGSPPPQPQIPISLMSAKEYADWLEIQQPDLTEPVALQVASTQDGGDPVAAVLIQVVLTQTVQALKAVGVAVLAGCSLVGLPRSTFYRRSRGYRHYQPVAAPMAHRDRRQPAALSDAERAVITDVLSTEEYEDLSVQQAYWRALDAGSVACSERTFYRVANDHHMVGDRRRRRTTGGSGSQEQTHRQCRQGRRPVVLGYHRTTRPENPGPVQAVFGAGCFLPLPGGLAHRVHRGHRPGGADVPAGLHPPRGTRGAARRQRLIHARQPAHPGHPGRREYHLLLPAPGQRRQPVLRITVQNHQIRPEPARSPSTTSTTPGPGPPNSCTATPSTTGTAAGPLHPRLGPQRHRAPDPTTTPRHPGPLLRTTPRTLHQTTQSTRTTPHPPESTPRCLRQLDNFRGAGRSSWGRSEQPMSADRLGLRDVFASRAAPANRSSGSQQLGAF